MYSKHKRGNTDEKFQSPCLQLEFKIDVDRREKESKDEAEILDTSDRKNQNGVLMCDSRKLSSNDNLSKQAMIVHSQPVGDENFGKEQQLTKDDEQNLFNGSSYSMKSLKAVWYQEKTTLTDEELDKLQRHRLRIYKRSCHASISRN